MTTKRAILHIGKHKTGTTSFQKYLADHRDLLEKNGVLFVPLSISTFIAASVVRNQLEIPPVKRLLKSGVNPSNHKAYAMLKEFLYEKKFSTLLLSCEHFSYFRKQEEISALKALLFEAAQIEARKVSVCLVLRDPKQFLESYINQLVKKGYETSNEELSPYYCREDSWLVDDSAIKELWESNFNRLDILNYEVGNIVPRLCEVMDLPKSKSVNSYFLNKRTL